MNTQGKVLTGFHWIDIDNNKIWQAFEDEPVVVVSESYAWHKQVALNDTVELLTDLGWQTFRVAGVYRDYGSEHGVVTLSRANYERYWTDRGIATMGLYLSSAADLADVENAVRALSRDRQALRIRSTASLREASLEVFDRTFAITSVLRVLATAVAFVGVLSALMALQLERAREVGVLRALGLTQRQVWLLLVSQAALLGAIAGVLCIPAGVGTAHLLTTIINQRAFGWSLDFVLNPGLLVESFVLAVAAALLAGVYPAIRMTRVPPATVLRRE